MLVSDLPFAGDPWAASVPCDVTALVTRFPIVSNGYQRSQVATGIGRPARYVSIQFPPGTTRALTLEKVDIRGVGTVAGATADEMDRLENALKRLADFDTRLAPIETKLNTLLSPLREIEAALARQVCTGIPGVPCYSVNDVLGLVQAGKDFIGLSKLEDLAFSILDPVINKVLGPIQAVFPAPPSFPALDLGLPEFSGMLNDVTVWNEFMAELRNLLNMPSIFQCAKANGVVEEAPPVGEEQ